LRPINDWEVRRYKTGDEQHLLSAASDGKVDIVKSLLDKGVNPNIRGKCKELI